MDEARGHLQVFEYLPHKVVREAGEGRLKVKKDEGSVFVGEAVLHGRVFNIENVGHHASSREEASLGFTDPVVKNGLHSKSNGSSDEPVVSADNGKRTSFRGSKDLSMYGVYLRGLFGQTNQVRPVEVLRRVERVL